MAATARLSPELQTRAKIYAVRLGISINALIAIALDSYLRVQGAEVIPEEAISGPVARPGGEGGGPTPQPQAPTQPGLSRRQRKRQERSDRARGKR